MHTGSAPNEVHSLRSVFRERLRLEPIDLIDSALGQQLQIKLVQHRYHSQIGSALHLVVDRNVLQALLTA